MLELEKMIQEQFNWSEEETLKIVRKYERKLSPKKETRVSKKSGFHREFSKLAQREQGVSKRELEKIPHNPWSSGHSNPTQAMKESVKYCSKHFAVDIEKVGSKWQLKVDKQSKFDQIFETIANSEGDVDVTRFVKGLNQVTVRKEMEKRGAVNAGGMKFRVDNNA